MEEIIETLPSETKIIMQIYKASLEDMMKKEIKLKEKDLELAMQLKEKDQELAMQLKEKDQELAMQLKEKDQEIKLKEKDLELAMQLKEKDLEMKLKVNDLATKLNNLKNEYALHNWKDMKVQNKLSIRSVLELFEKKHLYQTSGMSRGQKYEEFANKQDVIDEVRSSDFTPKTFAETAVVLFNNMNKAAHPTFQCGDTLMVQAECLSESEWRVLNLLWKLYPLPEGKLQKTKI